MKAIFIVYGQSLSQLVEQSLDKLNIRGFTRWEEVQGRGGKNGEPHYGTHAWPSKNGSLLVIVEDHTVEPLLQALRKINEKGEQQGLNAFVWNVEKTM